MTVTAAETSVALVEIGTNSAKLLIAACRSDGRFRVRHFARTSTRIGGGMALSSAVDAGGLERTLDAMREFRETARRHHCRRRFAFATFALRGAANSPAAIRRIESALGCAVNVLSGRAEATFAYRSAAAALDLTRPHTVLFDAGGGSTELVAAAGGRVRRTRSLPIGALHLTERFVKSDPVRPDELRALRNHVDDVVARATRAMGIDALDPGAVALVASGGGVFTVTNMISHQRGRRRSGRGAGPRRIRSGDVSLLLRRCAALPLARRRKIAGLEADRADIIVAGLVLVGSMMRRTRKRVLLVNPGGVREGALLHLIQRGFRW